MKLLIIGHARSGKDTCAEIFKEYYGVNFCSSSLKASQLFIFDLLKNKYGYKSFEECFEDRVNHREEWHNLIVEYNKDDKTKLTKDILKDSDCYVGMRSNEELKECINQGIFDIIIWVDAVDRVPLEDSSSFNIDRTYADIIIDNNGSEQLFKDKVIRIGKVLFKKQ